MTYIIFERISVIWYTFHSPIKKISIEQAGVEITSIAFTHQFHLWKLAFQTRPVS